MAIVAAGETIQLLIFGLGFQDNELVQVWRRGCFSGLCQTALG